MRVALRDPHARRWGRGLRDSWDPEEPALDPGARCCFWDNRNGGRKSYLGCGCCELVPSGTGGTRAEPLAWGSALAPCLCSGNSRRPSEMLGDSCKSRGAIRCCLSDPNFLPQLTASPSHGQVWSEQKKGAGVCAARKTKTQLLGGGKGIPSFPGQLTFGELQRPRWGSGLQKKGAGSKGRARGGPEAGETARQLRSLGCLAKAGRSQAVWERGPCP